MQWKRELFIVLFNRPAPQVEILFSVMSAEVTDREAKNVHHLLWNTDSARELSGGLYLTLLLTVLSESIESMRPSDTGELIGMDAFNAGQLAKDLRLSKLIEGNNKGKHPIGLPKRGRNTRRIH